MDEVMERARDYARTEFCVEIGEYDKEAMEEHSEQLDEELWRKKYSHIRDEREEQNES